MSSLAALLDEAEHRPLRGWDLSYDGRISSTSPWDFEAMVDARLRRSPDLLDMGTGGGEWLSRRPFPKGRTVATEAWPPNVPVARARLEPLGAVVIAVAGAPDNADQPDAAVLPALPFADAFFHLVTNRHESFVAAEIARILAPGGGFITQQIASNFDAPLRQLIGAPAAPLAPHWRLSEALQQVGGSGLEVVASGEGDGLTTFADIGALAWYLIHVPWVLPGFTIAGYRTQLERLHGQGAITVRQPKFWLEARKPARAAFVRAATPAPIR